MLNNEKICDLFHKEYRAESTETESLYKRCQFAVAGIALLSGILSATTRRDLLPLYWTRVDVFLYYSFVGLAGLLLVSAAVCLVVSIKPRRFEALSGLGSWLAWRDEYRKELADLGYADGDPVAIEDAVADATCDQVTARLAMATDWNAETNRVKMRWFNYSFYSAAAAMGAIAMQAGMHAIMFLNGVTAK